MYLFVNGRLHPHKRHSYNSLLKLLKMAVDDPLRLLWVMIVMALYCRVRMWRGGLRFSLLLPPLSFSGASIAKPLLRFHILLIEPDRPISGIRLSDKTHNLRTRKVIRRSPNPQLRTVFPGVQRPSILRTTANATTWADIRFPDHQSRFFLRFSM